MAVITGLSKFFIAGNDLSGDASQLSIKGGPAALNISGLDLVGTSRIAGRYGGSIDYAVWNNPARAHAYLGPMPQTSANIMIPFPGTAIGDYVAMLMALQVDYAPAIGQDLAMSFAASALASDGFPIEWGQLATAGKRTDTGATATGTGTDLGIPAGVPAVNITSVGVANPGQVNATAHGLVTGDSVIIAGTTTTPSINNEYTVTFVNANQFTIPVNVTAGQAGAAGTVQRTSRHGWSAQNQVFSVTGTSMTIRLQDDAENVAGTFADLAGGAFAAVTSGTGHAAERIQSAAGIIRRYVRAASAGTFNPGTFCTGVQGKEG